MNHRGFIRGRGYGPRGVRGKIPFGRPHFPHAPFRHMGPPRPGHPGSFMPWQPNGIFPPQMQRGNLQFRPRGRGRRICSYDDQFAGFNRSSVPPNCDEVPSLPSSLPSNNLQVENNPTENVSRLPLLGSEEERQQKITETADRLKQKLSSFNNDNVADIWSDDISLSFDTVEDGCIENKGIPELRYEAPELNLTYDDLKDIGKINSSNPKLDTSQDATDIFIVTNDNDVILEENENGSQEVAPIFENLADNECIENEGWEFHESVDDSCNLEQPNLCEDNNVNEILQSDLQYDVPEDNISQEQCQQEQQQDTCQETDIDQTDDIQEQNVSEMPNLQNISLSIESTDQEILQETTLQDEKEKEPIMDSEIQENISSSYIETESLNYNSSQPLLSQSALTTPSISNDQQLSNMQENSFHSRPPKLSPHIEQELPVDFDPTTPPPILLKQDQPHTLPPPPVYNLPPMFNPTEPPPNMRHLIEPGISHENTHTTWNINPENQISGTFKNNEIHTDLNIHGGPYIPQQLPLEIPSQNNLFLPPPIDTINFPPLFPMLPAGHPGIETNIPPVLSLMQPMPPTYIPPSSSQEPLPFSDAQCDMDKNDELSDMQEAMKFAKQMTDITETKNEEISSPKSLSEDCNLSSIKPINDIESISLPPGKPKNKNKIKRTKRDDADNKKEQPEEQRVSDNVPSEECNITQDECSKSKNATLIDEQERPKVVFNLNNKIKTVSTTWRDVTRIKRSKKNSIAQSRKARETHATTSGKNVKNAVKNNEEEMKKSRVNLRNTVSSGSTNQDTASPRKRSQPSILPKKVNIQKSLGSRVEKNENSNLETSWKDKIINRFLKMTKNEIYNMVNNTSLRKFNVIMKRLVKEKRPTLSLEMRHAQGEKMKMYDQQEFMKQLNAMLDPDATVAITDLPTEFIHHLNEVLQLDVSLNDYNDATTSISQSDCSENTNEAVNTVTHTITTTECIDKTISSNDVNQESVRKKDHTIKTGYDKDTQAHNTTRNNDSNLKDDACSTKSNKSSASSRLSTLQHDLDDIFLELTKRNQTPSSAARKDYNVEQRNTRKSDDDMIFKNMQQEIHLEDDTQRSENCAHWIEKCNRWKRKEQEEPDLYRNLTKEEWEAKYGTQANLVSSSSATNKIDTNDNIPATNKIDTNDNRNLSIDMHIRNVDLRRHSEPSKHSKKHKNEKHKRSRRHSDDRKHIARHSEDNSDTHDSNSSSSNSTSTSSSSSSSSDNCDKREPNVTKLLRVIKEKEKVAKKMSLSETIRDEVNAEIERERKQKSKKLRKSHKSAKSRKEKNVRHKKNKKKSRKKVTSPTDSSSEEDISDEEESRLLTEDEIKKEIMEDQMTQQVVIKEELDIGQEENVGDTELTNSSSHHAVMESRAMSSLSKSYTQHETAPSTNETVSTVQSHIEDQLPTSSLTHMEIKTQLKQADTSSNKISLKIPSNVPQDRSTINPLNISESSENLNKHHQITDTSYNRDRAEISSVINNLVGQVGMTNNMVQIPCDGFNEKSILKQLDVTMCTSAESSTNIVNIPRDNEISASTDISGKISKATVSKLSDIPVTDILPKKQGHSKKIDIKTYYERTMHRRMNEQGKLKKVAEPAKKIQDILSKPGTTKMKTTINESASRDKYTYSGPIQDPRLISSARLISHASSTVNKDDVARTKVERNTQQEVHQIRERSEFTASALQDSEKHSVTKVKKINKSKLQDTADVNALCNVVTMPEIVSSKFKKCSDIKSDIDKKLQSDVSADPKKFKNIRSEGSKELKLKKETAKIQKAKKSAKSANIISTKIHNPEVTETKNTEKTIQKKETGDISNVSKIEIEQATQLINPHAHKIINNNTEIEPTKVSSEKIDNNSGLAHNKAKECSLNLEFTEPKNVEENVGNQYRESIAVHEESSSEITQDAEACKIEHVNEIQHDTTRIETANEDHSARNISKVTEVAESTTCITDSGTEVTGDIGKTSNEDFSSSSDIQQSDATKDVELPLNCVNQIQAGEFDKQDILDDTNHSAVVQNVKGIADESDMITQVDNIDNQDNSNVNCVADIDNCKNTEMEKQQNYVTLDPVADYTNDMSITTNENFNITLGDTLLASDKEYATSEKSDKSDLIADEGREECVEKSSATTIMSTLHEDNSEGKIDEGNKTEKRLNEERYTLNIELAVKRPVFVNEEETIQEEIQSKDFTNKLTTAADPNLSDTLAISDETLKSSEIQSAENMNNNVYLETNISAEKISCDKLPDFDPDEHLDNMFYLDVRLQNDTFDNKDNASAHFSDDQQTSHYGITPTVTPESTIAACSDLPHDEIRKPEQCKFDLKQISSTDNDCNLKALSTEHSPDIIDTVKILNTLTTVALKEAETSVFLRSPNNISTATEEAKISEEATQRNETDTSYQWHSNIHNNTNTHTQEVQNNITTVSHDLANVNTVSSTQDSTNDRLIRKNIDQNISLTTSIHTEMRLHNNVQRCNPVVELRKMKELDSLIKKQAQEKSKRTKDIRKNQKKDKDEEVLHKLKDNRFIKHQPRKSTNRKSLAKKLKDMEQLGKLSDTTKEAILARMLEIDIEMHKLTAEKLKLHELLQNSASSENYASNISAESKAKGDTTVSIQCQVSPTSTSQLAQSAEISQAKLNKSPSALKQSPVKHGKRTISHSSEDDEIMRYTHKMKTPVIRWKKIPRLEEVVRREDEDEEDQDERTQQRTLHTVTSKKRENSIDTSKDAVPSEETGKFQPDAAIDYVAQLQRDNTKTDERTTYSNDESSRHATCSDKNVNDQSEARNSIERETENTKHFPIHPSDIDKQNNSETPYETMRASSQSSNAQVHSTPEPLSIYSDDSTWDSLVQNTASEMHEKRKSTGLALLEETFRKERAISRKMKAVARRQKKKQLNTILKSVNKLTMEEEQLPLSKLYIRKLQQKRDLLDSLSQRKEDPNNIAVDSKMENIEEVINAVAENRVEDLYVGPQAEMQVLNDIPTTSNVFFVSQPDNNQFYVDAEANANSDWPCREKEITLQPQDNNNIPDDDGLNRVFTVVSQNIVPLYEERNVEPDSSVTPEESHSSDCEHARLKELNSVALRNFDIRVSVPKTLIRDDFSLELLQKLTENGAAAGSVDSTTNAFANTTNIERLEQNNDDESPQNVEKTANSIVKSENNSVIVVPCEKNEHAVDTPNSNDKQNTVTCELQEQQTTDSVRNAESVSRLDTANSKCPGADKNENSDNSVASNDKIVTIDISRDSSISNSISDKVDTEQKQSDTITEQLSNDMVTATQNSNQNVEDTSAARKEINNSENASHAFEEILNDVPIQRTNSPVPADLMNEKSEESKELSLDEGHSSDRMSTSTISSDKTVTEVKTAETNKKSAIRKKEKLVAVRRSYRYINENVKPNKINEIDASSNSSEQELSEKDTTTRRSKSPACGIREEKTVNTSLPARKNRSVQKMHTNNRNALVDAEFETNKVESTVKSRPSTVLEAAASKNNNTSVMKGKRKQHTRSQMMNCKVILIDCKHTLLKADVSLEALSKFGITAVNPYVRNDTSCDQDIAVIPAAAPEETSSFLDKSDDRSKVDIEVIENGSSRKDNNNDIVQEPVARVATEIDEKEPSKTQYTVHKGPILDIKVFEDSFLAASEDGKIYRYSQMSNGILNIYKGHKSAVTCIYTYKSDIAGVKRDFMYSGSLDGTLRCYNIASGTLARNTAQVNSPIQCMDQAWGIIFVGTKSGHVSRFHIKTGMIKGTSIQFSDKSVLALKATNEGARRILIVASRNQPITIRDAQTGLFLRTISSQKNHTVYSLMRHQNLIYCGTSSTSINVFDFTTGEQTIQYDAGVGIVCMRLYEQLLFAGCYDGNIYVFDTRNHKLVCSIPGPGNMLLSIEVLQDKIIAGSKDKRLHSWQMPIQVRALLHNVT